MLKSSKRMQINCIRFEYDIVMIYQKIFIIIDNIKPISCRESFLQDKQPECQAGL